MGQYDTTLGALLIGVVGNTYLYGIVSHQYADYYNAKFDDKLRVKISVLILLTLDTVQTVLMIYLCWVLLVDNFGNFDVILAVPQWPSGFIPLGTAITASITHTFLGLRILGMSKNRFLFALLLILTLAEFATGSALSIRMWMMQDNSELAKLKSFTISWLLIQTTLDVVVSALLITFLQRHRTGHVQTDTVINRLTRGAIQTGAFSAFLAIAGLVSFVVRPDTVLYATFMIPIGRTYTTTLMNTLNIRVRLKKQLLDGEELNFLSMPEVTWRGAAPANPNQDILGSIQFNGQTSPPASPYVQQFGADTVRECSTIGKVPPPRPEHPFTASITLPKATKKRNEHQ